MVPYASNLDVFVRHAQQLYMESNGKLHNPERGGFNQRSGVVFGGLSGTDCQHSVFQGLHQGNVPMWLDFVGFLQPQTKAPQHIS